jgi:hypothetical protein
MFIVGEVNVPLFPGVTEIHVLLSVVERLEVDAFKKRRTIPRGVDVLAVETDEGGVERIKSIVEYFVHGSCTFNIVFM